MSSNNGMDRSDFSMRVATFGDIKTGDYLLDENNNPIKVEGVTETHIPERMFKVEDNNGNFINVSGTHLWYVVTDNDRATYSERKKESYKVLKPLTEKKIVKDRLISFATNDYQKDGQLETTVIDILSLLFDIEDLDLKSPQVLDAFYVVSRIAESVGPVSETNIEYRDMAFEENKEYHKIVYYDARLLSQQVLSFAEIKPYNKKYKKRIGKVITTQMIMELIESGHDVYIPD